MSRSLFKGAGRGGSAARRALPLSNDRQQAAASSSALCERRRRDEQRVVELLRVGALPDLLMVVVFSMSGCLWEPDALDDAAKPLRKHHARERRAVCTHARATPTSAKCGSAGLSACAPYAASATLLKPAEEKGRKCRVCV